MCIDSQVGILQKWCVCFPSDMFPSAVVSISSKIRGRVEGNSTFFGVSHNLEYFGDNQSCLYWSKSDKFALGRCLAYHHQFLAREAKK